AGTGTCAYSIATTTTVRTWPGGWRRGWPRAVTGKVAKTGVIARSVGPPVGGLAHAEGQRVQSLPLALFGRQQHVEGAAVHVPLDAVVGQLPQQARLDGVHFDALAGKLLAAAVGALGRPGQQAVLPYL